MELLDNLPSELHWNVLKYMRHEVAQLFLDAPAEANKQIRHTILDIVYPPLIVNSLNPPVTIQYTLVHRIMFYTGKW